MTQFETKTYFQYVFELGLVMNGLRPHAPDDMVKVILEDERQNKLLGRMPSFAGIAPEKQDFMSLKTFIEIKSKDEDKVQVELPTSQYGKAVTRYFPLYGIKIQKGYIVALTRALREDLLLYNSLDSYKETAFAPSALDVSGPYEE